MWMDDSCNCADASGQADNCKLSPHGDVPFAFLPPCAGLATPEHPLILSCAPVAGDPTHRHNAAREASPEVAQRPAGEVGSPTGGHRGSATGDREAVNDDLQGTSGRLGGPEGRGKLRKRDRLLAGTRAGAGRPSNARPPDHRPSRPTEERVVGVDGRAIHPTTGHA